jgi:hypothetical protein
MPRSCSEKLDQHDGLGRGVCFASLAGPTCVPIVNAVSIISYLYQQRKKQSIRTTSRPGFAEEVRLVPTWLLTFPRPSPFQFAHCTLLACIAPHERLLVSLFPAVCATAHGRHLECGDRVSSPRPEKGAPPPARLARAVLPYGRFHAHQQQNSLQRPGFFLCS